MADICFALFGTHAFHVVPICFVQSGNYYEITFSIVVKLCSDHDRIELLCFSLFFARSSALASTHLAVDVEQPENTDCSALQIRNMLKI